MTVQHAHRRQAWMARAGALLTIFVIAVPAATASAHRQAAAKPTAKVAQAAHLASEGISDVVSLHDLALLVKPGEPRARNSFTQLATGFAAEAQACMAIGTPAAALRRVLRVYGQLAAQVGTASKKKNATLPASFTVAIKANDMKWEAALKAIGKADHANLLKTVPKLLYAKVSGA
jgi:hypothetical protein